MSVPNDDVVAGDVRQGVLVVVMGAKGGCGTTLVAVNLAAELAAERDVCLLDLDLCKGDVAGFLDLTTDASLTPVLERLDRLDTSLLRGATVTHDSGLKVLAQPHDLAELHHVEADEVGRLLEAVRAEHDIVVVDVGSRVDVASLAAAMAADELLLLATPDVPALRDAARVLDLLTRLGRAQDRIHLVVNRRVPGHGIAVERIGSQLGLPVAAEIRRDDAACARADTEGRLLGEVAPRSEVALDLDKLWDRLHGGAAPTGNGRWAWLRGRTPA